MVRKKSVNVSDRAVDLPRRASSAPPNRLGRKGPKNLMGAVGQLAPGNLVQMPDLTHKLSLEDRAFLDNYLNPCDERMGPSSGSKVPDGTLPNSGINGFREIINVAPPFAIPSDPGAIGGPLWSLIILKLPTIREALYLLAVEGRDDLSVGDQQRIAAFYSGGNFTVFPEWVTVSGTQVRASVVVWSQLRNQPALNNLFKQVRITKSGITTFHNAPDLYNQGIVVTAQWNCDKSGKSEEVQGNALTSTRGGTFNLGTNDILSTGSFFTALGSTITMFPPNSATNTTGLSTSVIPISQLGYTGSVSITAAGDTGQTVPLDEGGTFQLEINNTGQAATYVLTSTNADGLVSVATGPLTYSVGANSFSVNWVYVENLGPVQITNVELPPLDTQSIIQSTPKAVVYPMKQYNGAYSVLRSWEPVFLMQETDNQSPISWSRRGAATSYSVSSSAAGDLLDLNFGTCVQAIMGISLAASVTVKMIQDVEFVAGDSSPWQGFMNPNVNVDTQVISLARAISLQQPFAFPQTFNSMGTLLDSVEGLLEKIPVVGQFVPLVSRIVKSVFPPKVDNQPHEEVKQDDIGALIKMILSKLQKL